MRRTVVVVLSLFSLAVPTLVHADAYTPVQTYVAPPKLMNFYFGSSVAFLGDRVAVGSPIVTGQEPDDAGALFVYDRASAELLTVATSPAAAEDNYLGSVLATIDGDLWTNDGPATRIFDSVFGALGPGVPYDGSLAEAGGLAIIGDAGYYYTYGDWNAGAVHVLNAATKTFVRLVENPDHGAGDQFGQAVAVSADYLVVGAPLDDPGGVENAGSVYVFDLATGALLRTLTSPDPDENDGFGWAVAVIGDRIAVGEPGDDGLDNGAGQAYLFDAATGAHLATMSPTHPVLHSMFGDTMAVDGTRLIVGAPGRYGSAPGTNPSDPFPNEWQLGVVEVFDGTTGAHTATIAPPGPPYRFGISLAVDDGQLLIGGGGTLIGGTVAPTAVLFDACGNGAVRGDEQCDDGNTTGGDGCSAACQLELCPPVRDPGCRTSPKAKLVVKRAGTPAHDTVKWKWNGGGNVAGDLGDPSMSTAYVLCLYHAAMGGQLELALAAPAGGMCGAKPCWRSVPGGFVYADSARTPDGIASAKVRVSPDGRGRLGLGAKGARIGLATASGSFVAQMRNSAGGCWQ
jgi:cysteine-rich repeat protein